jgi:hypothetical protein
MLKQVQHDNMSEQLQVSINAVDKLWMVYRKKPTDVIAVSA